MSPLPATLRERVGNARRYVYRRENALRRAWHVPNDGEHLVPDPTFVISSVRSGSTLLRSMLDTHTRICAPHELHMATMQVSSPRWYAVEAWRAEGLETEDLENLLWDRALHRMLVRSGKQYVVDKTPQNVFVWPRIHAFWPGARYLHLRRHPGSVFQSLVDARPEDSLDTHVGKIVRYVRALDEARAALPGPTVRYEELTVDPVGVLTGVCEAMGVRFQKRMLNYRRSKNRSGLGDWSANIASGRVQQHRPLPATDELPAPLRPLVRAWDY